MNASFIQLLVFLFISIAVIVLLTAKFRVHAFFALIIACLVMGLGAGMPVMEIVNVAKQGFGSIMQSLALIIVLGTTLGVLLEHSGSTETMALFILKITGAKRASLAMSLTGFIVGLPIFCDSGFIVLSGLNKSLARRTNISIVATSVSLATGLYAVHCLVPPHPGAAAAAGTIGVDFGKLLAIGVLVALPGMLAAHAWARFASRKITVVTAQETDVIKAAPQQNIVAAFLPVLIPIILIALRSFIVIEQGATSTIINVINILGDPVVALSVGVLLAFATFKNWTRNDVAKLLQESAEKAGGILVIIGAGGAFGAILAATKIGIHFSEAVALESLGILFPFLLTSVLKTAQGSSTVAIITAASIVAPLLPALHLNDDNGKLLCMLAMGAGSMMISHANDAYFWVIAKFSGIEMKPMLRVYSVATIFMGLITLLMVYVLAAIL